MSIYGRDGRVTCVVALDDDSTNDLAQFLESLGVGAPPSPGRRVIDRLGAWCSAPSRGRCRLHRTRRNEAAR